jgi:hypothetical protein
VTDALRRDARAVTRVERLRMADWQRVGAFPLIVRQRGSTMRFRSVAGVALPVLDPAAVLPP